MDLRFFIEELAHRGLLLKVQRAVSTHHELGGLISRFQGHTLLFQNIIGHKLPVLANVTAHRGLLATLIDASEGALTELLLNAVKNPTACIQKSAGDQSEVVVTNLNLLEELPMSVDYDRQERPILNSAIMVVRDHETGLLNTSFHVLEVISSNEFGVHVSSKHFARIYTAYQKTGRVMPAALLIGMDPWTWLASTIVIDHPPTELEVAGAFRRQPIELGPCQTIDLHVPIGAEILLEGEILPHRRVRLGPEPKPSGYYGSQENGLVFQVRCMRRKPDAFFLTLVNGTVDHWNLLSISKEVNLLPFLRTRHNGVMNVAFSGQTCLVSIEKGCGADVRAILTDVLQWDTGFRGNIKVSIVFDNDVDVSDRHTWEFALYTRLNTDKMIAVEGPTSRHDPFSTNGRIKKLGIDATLPAASSSSLKSPYIPGAAALDLLITDDKNQRRE